MRPLVRAQAYLSTKRQALISVITSGGGAAYADVSFSFSAMHKFTCLVLGAALLRLPAQAQDIGPALNMTLMAGWTGGEAVRYDLVKRAAAQLGEEMKRQAVVPQGCWQSAVQHKQLAAYQQQTAQLFKTSYGLDLGALRLTAQGLAKR